MKKISIIASFRNEEKNIPIFYKSIVKSFEKIRKLWNFEIIFVDDCSTDKSFLKLKNIFAKDKRVKVIKMINRCGHSPSIQAALNKISSDNYSVIIDCDMQDDPRLIAKNLSKFNSNTTVHFIREKRDDGFFQKIYSFAAYKILKLISLGQIYESAGYFKILPPSVTKKIKKDKEYYPYWNYLLTKYSNKNERVFYLRKKRLFGLSKYGFFNLNPWLTFFGGAFYFRERFILFILSLICTSFYFSINFENFFISKVFLLISILLSLKLISFLVYLFFKFNNQKIKYSYKLYNFN